MAVARMIHCVPLKEKYKEVKGEREMNTYNPNPIDTSDVVLTPELDDLVKKFDITYRSSSKYAEDVIK